MTVGFIGDLMRLVFKLLASAALIYFSLRGMVAAGQFPDSRTGRGVLIASILGFSGSIWLLVSALTGL